MRDYAKVSPQFWIGTTGKALRAAGNETQLVALYLLTNPHANMLGLYYLPKLFISHESGLPIGGASKGLQRCIEADFCSYDPGTEVVWVHEMAAYQIGERLTEADKRCIGIQNEYDSLPQNPFLKGFFDRYAAPFHMRHERNLPPGNASPSEGPSEPHRSQEHEQEHEQDVRGPQHPKVNGKKASPKKPEVPLPDDFALDADLERYVLQHLPDADPPGFLEDFRLKAQNKQWRYADWRLAFMTHVRNARPGSGHFAAGQYPKRGANGVRWQ